MTRAILFLLIAPRVLILALALQGGVVLPEPGNPQHEAPPPGHICRPAGPGVDAGHACACRPTCMEGRDEEGNPNGTKYRVEDVSRCRVACHPKSCACLSDCEP